VGADVRSIDARCSCFSHILGPPEELARVDAAALTMVGLADRSVIKPFGCVVDVFKWKVGANRMRAIPTSRIALINACVGKFLTSSNRSSTQSYSEILLRAG
jgi:hypothetical protein